MGPAHTTVARPAEFFPGLVSDTLGNVRSDRRGDSLKLFKLYMVTAARSQANRRRRVANGCARPILRKENQVLRKENQDLEVLPTSGRNLRRYVGNARKT